LPTAVVWLGLSCWLVVVCCLRCSTTVGACASGDGVVVGCVLAGGAFTVIVVGGGAVVALGCWRGGGGGSAIVGVVLDSGAAPAAGVLATGFAAVLVTSVGGEVPGGALAPSAPLIGTVNPAALKPPPASTESAARHTR
jgi:hypothetical protein